MKSSKIEKTNPKEQKIKNNYMIRSYLSVILTTLLRTAKTVDLKMAELSFIDLPIKNNEYYQTDSSFKSFNNEIRSDLKNVYFTLKDPSTEKFKYFSLKYPTIQLDDQDIEIEYLVKFIFLRKTEQYIIFIKKGDLLLGEYDKIQKK